jgi:arylsulfatase A-like enzyme
MSFTVSKARFLLRHLGLKKEHAPCSRGFTKSFTFLAGAGNHYNYEPQLDEQCPRLPAVSGQGLWMENDRFLDHRTDLPKDFYSTTSFTDKFLQYLEDRTAEEKDIPFFGYLPFTAPHWPLQAPREAIDKYAGEYDSGPDALRLRRLQALVDRGLVPSDVKPAPMVGETPREWDEMDTDERRDSARRMETYAAMVDLMDQNIQRLVEYLEATDELDNTFILFMSDNGAEGQLLEALPVMRQSPHVVIQKYYNNSVENIGNHDSFIWYGPRWACAASAPSRGMKCWTTEGGIRCPCILRYPP